MTATPAGAYPPIVAGCMEESVQALLLMTDDLHVNLEDLPYLWDASLPPGGWRTRLARWIRQTTGRPLRYYPARPRRPCIAVGWSPRDPKRVRHAVLLGATGTLVFDPHPSGAGVIRPDAFYWW